MNLFKESRFIFEDPPGMPKRPEINPGETPEGENEGGMDNLFQKNLRKARKIKESYEKRTKIADALEKTKGDVPTPEAVGDKVKKDSERDLSKLKEEFAPVYGIQQLDMLGSLSEFEWETEFSYDPNDKTYKSVLKNQILEFYKKKEKVWSSLKELDQKSERVPTEGSEMMEFMASAATVSIINKIKEEREIRQKFFDSWSGKNEGLKIKVQGTTGTHFKVVFPDKFEKERKAAQTEEQQKKEEERVSNTAEQKKVDRLIKSPIGKILAWIGYKNEDGKPDREKYEAIINGTDWFGALVVGLFGYTEFVGEFYTSAKEMMSPKMKAALLPIEKRARSSKFSAEAWRKTEGYKKIMGKDAIETSKYAEINADDFVTKYLGKEADVDAKGIKIKDNYDMGKAPGKYKVVLKAGAKIIVPIGGKLTLKVNGKDRVISAEKDKVKEVEIKKDDKKFELSGIIPKNTIFKNVKFEKVEAASGDKK